MRMWKEKMAAKKELEKTVIVEVTKRLRDCAKYLIICLSFFEIIIFFMIITELQKRNIEQLVISGVLFLSDAIGIFSAISILRFRVEAKTDFLRVRKGIRKFKVYGYQEIDRVIRKNKEEKIIDIFSEGNTILSLREDRYIKITELLHTLENCGKIIKLEKNKSYIEDYGRKKKTIKSMFYKDKMFINILVKTCNMIGGGLFFYSFFYFSPENRSLLGSLFVLEPLCIFFLYLYYANIGTDCLIYSLLLPSFCGVFFALLTFDILSWEKVIILAVIIMTFLFQLVCLFSKKSKKGIWIILISCLFCYSMNSVLWINGLFPEVKGQTISYEATIREMYPERFANRGRFYKYCIWVDLKNGKNKKIYILEEIYRGLQKGDNILVEEKMGALRVPYITVAP